MTIDRPNRVSVLLVEDEVLIRIMIAGMIEDLGHVVDAEAGNIQVAIDLAESADFEFAVLDINVGGEKIDPVADIIACRAVPSIFASGYGAIGAPVNFRDRMVLQKPFLISALDQAIRQTLGQ